MDGDDILTDRPLVDLTIGGMPAPRITHDSITGGFWMSWDQAGTRIDVTLRDRDALRDLIRAALEAAAEPEAT